MRSFERNYIYFKKHLFDLYDVDIFFHTWDNSDNTIENIMKKYNIKNYKIEIYNNNFAEITNYLKNKITNKKPYDDNILDKLGIYKSIVPMFYGIYQSFLLKQDRKSTRLNSSHSQQSRMPSSA